MPSVAAADPPRGPGLFQIARANGETAITNIRRLAGAERTPGSRLILAAAILLAALAGAFYVVTLAAQYHFVLGQKHETVPSVIEALGLDAGMAVFALLALGLAMAGQSARTERMLVLACSLASAAMNYAAADVRSPRSILVYVMPPVFLAVTVDRVVAVIRRHVLGDAERSAWAAAGRALTAMARGLAVVLLYGLRFVLAPPSTGAGLRRVVLNAAPLPAAPDRPAIPAAEEVPAIEPPTVTEPPELEGASKKARLAWWYQRDDAYGDRKRTAEAAKRLAPKADLSEGTARAYIGAILDGLGQRSMSTAGQITGGVLRFLFGVIRFVVVLANRERVAAFVIVVMVVVLVLFFKLMLTRSAAGWRRVRSIRFRLWLGLRPGRGFASLPELWLRWGRLAAVSYGARSRPGLSLTVRLTSGTTLYAALLGRAQYGRRLYAPFELHLLVLAPPRTDKTGLLADQIIRHPGPVLTTSTRADLYALTSGPRSALGPVYVFNPEGVGGIPSTFAWDLLGVCRDELTAYRMADWLAGAVDGYGDLAWFEEQGTIAMSGLLLAAAMTGATLAEVYQWTQRRGQERALSALAEHGNPQLHAAVRALMEDNNKTAASIRTTIARALKWAVIPQLAAAADRRGLFSARDLALDGGTLHLIASGDSRSVITPLLRALASYVHYEAALAGSKTAAGRLDPPLLMAMDEVAQVCPVDLPSMLADSAGKGIRFVTVGHSLAKLEERYGRDGAANIWAISGVKMLLRGITEPQTLEDVSRVCGTLGDEDDDRVRIVPPDVLRRLPKHTALVINMDLSPAIVRVSRAWKRRGVRRLTPAPLSLPLQRTGEAEEHELIELRGEAAAPIPAVNGSARPGGERR